MLHTFRVLCERLLDLRYITYAGDEKAIITTATSIIIIVTEMMQTHNGYDVPYLTTSRLKKLKGILTVDLLTFSKNMKASISRCSTIT